MDIKGKLKGIMTEDEIQKFESSLSGIINEQVEARLVTDIDSIKKKYDSVAEEYCKKTISEGVETAKKGLIAEYDKKILALEDKCIKGLDLFIEQEILPQVSEDTIKKIAINEAFAPIVLGIKKVLEENYIAIDTEGSSILSEAKQEITDLKKQINEHISEKMALNERLEKVATFLLISESTNGLNDEQKGRVKEMFTDKPFDEVEGKIKGFVQFLTESEVKGGAGAAPAPAKDGTPGAAGVILEGAAAAPGVAPAAVKPEGDVLQDIDVIARAEKFMQ
jgi:hypothetical protein